MLQQSSALYNAPLQATLLNCSTSQISPAAPLPHGGSLACRPSEATLAITNTSMSAPIAAPIHPKVSRSRYQYTNNVASMSLGPFASDSPSQTLSAPVVGSLASSVQYNVHPKVKGHLEALQSLKVPLDKHAYLLDLRQSDPDAFYALILGNLREALPIVYTPTVGEGCQKFDLLFEHRQVPGLFISLADKGHIREQLDTWPHDVDIIVVTDGSRILGLGDLGVNGMGIPIGKLSLYSAAGGFHPLRTLPITLDTGSNNVALRERMTYKGSRQARAPDSEYFPFLDEFVAAVKDKWPKAVLQFEDFSSPHCFDLLERYRHDGRIFNDDIQGTGAVIAAGFVNAVKASGIPLSQQRIVFYGAGSAGQGVADTIKSVMKLSGMSEEHAKRCFYFVDSKGLVTTNRGDVLPDYKVAYARSDMLPIKSLDDVLETVKPTALIGLSAVPNAFTEKVVKIMARINHKPIIFALSNPTSKSELSAKQAIEWTEGKVIYAAGSPYDPVQYGGRKYEIAQGNNLYIFPGLGLGAFLSQSKEVSDGMVTAAVQALASSVPEERLRQGYIFPPLEDIRQVSAKVAAGVMEQARHECLAQFPGLWPKDTVAYVQQHMWSPAI